MIRVQLDLGEYVLGDILIRPLSEIKSGGINRYMFIILERSTMGGINSNKNGIVEIYGSPVSYIDLLHTVLDTSKRGKALIPTTGYEKSLLAVMETEMVV